MSQTRSSTSRLSGKVAVVTGASKGIGAAIAKRLGAEGAAVVVNYASDKAGADRVVETITSAGGKAVAVKGNVGEAAGIAALFGGIPKEYGPIDILVNNAGIFEFLPIEAVTEEHYRRQFDVNVFGPVFVTQAALTRFNPAGGSIVNISSVVSTAAVPGSSVYSGTKGALDAITRVLAAELGPKKIRVNAVNPGMVATEGATSFVESDFGKAVLADTPIGRLGVPDDIAAIVAFLASEDASWVTGETHRVSGGNR